MSHPTTVRGKGMSLKEASGWFAAGESFQKALTVLSDGTFRLFAWLCLKADRRTGRYETTHTELAVLLGKSRRAIAKYASELRERRVCTVCLGKNQFARTSFEICDDYWPYHRERSSEPGQKSYVASVRDWFLTLGCGNGRFTPSDARIAGEMQERGIPLEAVQDAILLGTCRKYISWLNGAAAEPIASVRYFEPVITEILEEPFSADYRAYLRAKNKQLAETWSQTAKARKHPSQGGCSAMGSPQIVQ